MVALLPPPPKNWDSASGVHVHKGISKPLHHHDLQPVGYEFSALARRARLNRSMLEDMQLQAALEELDDSALDDNGELEEETPELLAIDPKDWKNQDHYQVLGLSAKRWKATELDIKNAYRRKVLLHHPDKKKAASAASGKSEDDSFFKCIQKAWEIMSDDKKRRQWDSCDPTFDEDLPSAKEIAKGDFFQIFSKCFGDNARFSNTTPVPEIGDMDTPRDQLDKFYDYWYKFSSWRTFEFQDEDDVDSASCREEKRWLERKNRAARARRKKEDNARLTRLVDLAMKHDPRIAAHKAAEKAKKEAKKEEKERAVREAAEAVEREKREKEEAEARAAAEEKSKREQGKKDKEMLKRAIKKEKKAIKALLKPLLESEDQKLQLAGLQKLDVAMEKCKTLPDYEAFKAKWDAYGFSDAEKSDPAVLLKKLDESIAE